MTPALIISLHAKIEIVEVSEWYELQDSGTGDRFMSALERKLDLICGHPQIFARLNGSEIRKCRLEQWPYLIFYTFEESKIEVIAVIHTSRDPEYISSRLRS